MYDIEISIVVPVYKINEEVLKKSIISLINQDFEKKYEILLIDDGSPDDCGKICDFFRETNENISVFHTENKGVSHARNVGIFAAKGKYIVFVDPDDLALENLLSKLYSQMQQNIDLVMCNYNYGTKDTGTKKRYIFSDEIKLYEIAGAVIGGKKPLDLNITGAPWAKMYRKDIILENNIFFDEELPRSQDNEFNLRYLRYVKCCVYIDEKLYIYNFNEDSAVRKYWKNAYENSNILLKKIELNIKNLYENNIVLRKSFDRFVFGKIEDILYTNIMHRDNDEKISSRIEALKKILKNELYSDAIDNLTSIDGMYRTLLLAFLKRKQYSIVLILVKLREYLLSLKRMIKC